jgi:hypothetical protein
LNAIREVRRGLELVAKLTGELDARSPESGNLSVQLVYTNAPQTAQIASKPVLDAVPLPEPEGS